MGLRTYEAVVMATLNLTCAGSPSRFESRVSI
jgi:hypothetical protein